MSSQRTSFRRVGLLLIIGLLIGGPTVFVARHGSLSAAWVSISYMAGEVHFAIRATLPFTETAKRLHECQTNREKWNALGLRNYEYEYEAFCFCPNGGRHIVKVVNGRVASVIDGNTSEFVHEGDLRFYYTIEQRFEIVHSAIWYGADHYEVSYDPATGIPARTEYDYRTDWIDDEGWNTIRLLPPGANSRKNDAT